VPLTPCEDLTPAEWIAHSDVPWQQLVAFGPAGFESYGRLRFLPDPVHPGQPEPELGPDAPTEHEQLQAALDVLSRHTRTPDECYFCLWEGWGFETPPVIGYAGTGGPRSETAVPGIAPAFPPSVLNGPKVNVPHRKYYLFSGSLSQFGDWDAAEMWAGQARLDMPDPAFIWPADHSWCIANDVDPHYAGIGASGAAIEQLIGHHDLDVVPADPRVEPPAYT
jgi:hypothetical protein